MFFPYYIMPLVRLKSIIIFWFCLCLKTLAWDFLLTPSQQRNRDFISKGHQLGSYKPSCLALGSTCLPMTVRKLAELLLTKAGDVQTVVVVCAPVPGKTSCSQDSFASHSLQGCNVTLPGSSWLCCRIPVCSSGQTSLLQAMGNQRNLLPQLWGVWTEQAQGVSDIR